MSSPSSHSWGSGVLSWFMITFPGRQDALQFIGWGMSGALAVIIAIALNRRAEAMMGHNDLIEKGHVDERFKVALDSLGSQQQSVRIAAFYQFYHLATSSSADFIRSFFGILCVHLRQITRNHADNNTQGARKPTEEIQTLLDVLFKNQQDVFSKMPAQLRGVHLVGADLEGANLQKADFGGSKLQNAKFILAKLWGANFDSANLENAEFQFSDLRNSNFLYTKIHGADFFAAELHGADLSSAEGAQAAVDMEHAKADEETKPPKGYHLHKKEGGRWGLRKDSPPE